MFWSVNQRMACVPVKAIRRSKSSREKRVAKTHMLLGMLALTLQCAFGSQGWAERFEKCKITKDYQQDLIEFCDNKPELFDSLIELFRAELLNPDIVLRTWLIYHNRGNELDRSGMTAKLKNMTGAIKQAVKEQQEVPHPSNPLKPGDVGNLQDIWKYVSPGFVQLLLNVQQNVDIKQDIAKAKEDIAQAKDEQARKTAEHDLRKAVKAGADAAAQRLEIIEEAYFYKYENRIRKNAEVWVRGKSVSSGPQMYLRDTHIVLGIDPKSVHSDGSYNPDKIMLRLRNTKSGKIITRSLNGLDVLSL